MDYREHDYRGQVIDGKYELQALVGEGGMSKVYTAWDRDLKKTWAVKVIDKRIRGKKDELGIQSALEEANLIKTLDHPYIVRIVGIKNTPSNIFIIEDLIEGKNLEEHLANGPLPQAAVVKWGIQICEALDHLHTRSTPIIYRDMKPANIMIRPDSRDGKNGDVRIEGHDGDVKIMDFGIARQYHGHASDGQDFLGTEGYAAPEQFRGAGMGPPTARTDIFNLGATLYHLLTGQINKDPDGYQKYPIRYWNPQLSRGLEKILLKCTKRNPADRYQTCMELKKALENYHIGDEAYQRKLKKTRNAFFGTLIASAVCLAIGFGGLAMQKTTNNADYDTNMDHAARANSPAEQIVYYSNAIDIKPDNPEPYLGLVDVLKSDKVFTTEEEKTFVSKINPNLAALKQSSDYADLAFEVGKLYWYYYDYGKTEQADNQITRMKSAIEWFDDAVEFGSQSDDFYLMASTYRDIGVFNRDIPLNVMEASDSGLYGPYWTNLVTLVDMIQNSQEDSEIIRLEVYRLTVNAIDSYARKFRSEGVNQTQMQNLFDRVENGVNQMVTTSDKTSDICDDIKGKLSSARQAIDAAFR